MLKKIKEWLFCCKCSVCGKSYPRKELFLTSTIMTGETVRVCVKCVGAGLMSWY